MDRGLKGVMVGAGFFAGYHIEAWNRMDGAYIAAIADLDRSRGEEFAAKWGIARVFDDLGAMLQAEEPAFVDIVTGPESHRELTELAARHGVAVICQKPMAPTYGEALAMVETCLASGVRLVVHENWRWQPWYREIRKLVDGGVLGPVFHLSFLLRTGDGRGAEPYKVQPYFRRMERFLIYETLVHFLDTFRYLGGEVSRIWCRTGRLNPVMRGEDTAHIVLEFGSGATGVIDANRISGPMPPEPAFGCLRMEGEKGVLTMDGWGELTLAGHGEARRRHEYEIPQTGYRGDSVFATQRHFVECLESGQPSESEGVQYLKTVELVEAAYRSAKEGVAVQAGGR